MPGEAAAALTPDLLNQTAPEPLYRQIYHLLRERIVNGEIPRHERLPAEQELIRMLGVSRITVKRALNELANSGLVTRSRGRGTIVTFNAAAPTVKASFENLIDGLTRMGIETQVQLLDSRFERASDALAEALELEPGALVQRIERLRRLQGEPFSFLVTHVPADVARGYDPQHLASASLIHLLEQAGHPPKSAEQTITAAAADPRAAQLLDIPVGAPVLCIHRIMRDRQDRPIQDITAKYRADRFQYQMRLTRGTDRDWTTLSS